MTDTPDSPIILVRPEQPALIDHIATIHRVAFGRDGEADLINQLRETPEFDTKLSLMALFDGKVVGHALFFPVVIEGHEDIVAYGLGPIGVLPDFQNQHIGSALIYEGLEVCRKRKFDLLVVLGDPTYYGRFGFIPANQTNLSSKYDPAGEHFQVQGLRAGILDEISGAVHYHPIFDEV